MNAALTMFSIKRIPFTLRSKSCSRIDVVLITLPQTYAPLRGLTVTIVSTDDTSVFVRFATKGLKSVGKAYKH